MRADHLTELRWAMEPSIEATGGRLAFVVSGPSAVHDRLDYRVRVAETQDGTGTWISSPGPARRPRWSPNGSFLAVVSQTEQGWQVGLVDTTGEVERRGTLPGSVLFFDWSPDGTQVVCELAVGGSHDSKPRRKLFVMDIFTGRARLLLPDSFCEAWWPVWSPDGGPIAFLSNHGVGDLGANATSVWVLDHRGESEPRSLATGQGLLRALAWSPDGAALAYLGHKTDGAGWANNELWVVDAFKGGDRRLGGDLDRSIGQVVRGDDERGIGPPSLAWSPQGNAVLAAFADGGTSSIASFDLDGGWEPVVTGDRAVLEFDVAAEAGTIAFTWSDPLTPGEVAVVLPDGSERLSSDLARPLREEVALAPTERVTHLADHGGLIEGWLTLPVEATGSSPLVVQVHGGPHYPVGARFSFDAQRLAGHGFAVLRANPGGSQGYGAAFAAVIKEAWGGRDFSDLMGLVDEVVKQKPVDSRRLAIVGESYGGFMAAWAIGQSDRFAAAVSENGITDLTMAAGANPHFWHEEMGATPEEDPDRYRRLSPITAVGRIATPLLLIHAEADSISPIVQSEAMLSALLRLDRPAEMVRVPGEDHFVNLFGRPSRRLEKTRLLDEFLQRHLSGGTGGPAEMTRIKRKEGAPQ